MAITFSQSLRSLQRDRGYLAMVSLALAALLLAGWLFWFLFGRISFYASGQIVRVASDGAISASFAPAEAAQLQPGQRALIQPAGPVAITIGRWPATVMSLNVSDNQEQVLAELYPSIEPAADPNLIFYLTEGFTGTVRVEVERVSPARLIVAGQSAEVGRFSFEP